MGFFTKIFKKKTVLSYDDFWQWFQENEQTFFKLIKQQKNLEETLFPILSEKLDAVRDGFWFLMGMDNDETAELIITPDGVIENIVFVEELIASAPKIDGWKFTALKPSTNIDEFSLRMEEHDFTAKNLHFFPKISIDTPDEIHICVFCDDYDQSKKQLMTNGIYLFLDNYLGEMYSITIIDILEIIDKKPVNEELIPMSKIHDYLKWRDAEFVEKYQATFYDTENSNYQLLTAESKKGNPILVVVNQDVIKWNARASHPWILTIDFKYNGGKTGLPEIKEKELMEKIEDEILEKLIDKEGFLNVGRETGENERSIYFACKDFRKPSKVLDQIKTKYLKQIDLDFEIFQDKYWQSIKRFDVF